MTVDTAKNLLLVVIAVVILIAFLVAKYVTSAAMKALLILVLGGVVLGVWSQRQALSDCAAEVQEKVSAGDGSSTQCSFFGTTVTVDDVNPLGD